MIKTLDQKAKENQYPYDSKYGMWAVEITEYISRTWFKKGYELCQKEFDEKFCWISVDEQLPPLHLQVLLKCKSGFWDKGCLIHKSGDNMWSSSSGDIDMVTHWRLIN